MRRAFAVRIFVLEWIRLWVWCVGGFGLGFEAQGIPPDKVGKASLAVSLPVVFYGFLCFSGGLACWSPAGRWSPPGILLLVVSWLPCAVVVLVVVVVVGVMVVMVIVVVFNCLGSTLA